MIHSNENRMILDVSNLSVVFKNDGRKLSILDDISFQLASGESLGIVGESGSGKSITALSILKLIPSPPLLEMNGRIELLGTDLLRISTEEMRSVRGKKIGIVFQEPMSALNPVLTIGDQIRGVIRAHEPVSAKESRDRTIELLREVGMDDPEMRTRSYPHELSGGMRQRAMIAMALSCSPVILIADEPTTALDVTIQAQILDLLKKLREERRMSLIFISHDLGVIAEIADRLLVMRAGSIVEAGGIQEIFDAPAHGYTRKLLDLLPARRRLHAGF